MVQQPLLDQGLLIIEASRSHSDTQHSVGLIRTSDQPKAQTSAGQQTTLSSNRHACPGAIRTRSPNMRAAAISCLRPRLHWDRPKMIHIINN